jgi:hypothetical protein
MTAMMMIGTAMPKEKINPILPRVILQMCDPRRFRKIQMDIQLFRARRPLEAASRVLPSC